MCGVKVGVWEFWLGWLLKIKVLFMVCVIFADQNRSFFRSRLIFYDIGDLSISRAYFFIISTPTFRSLRLHFLRSRLFIFKGNGRTFWLLWLTSQLKDQITLFMIKGFLRLRGDFLITRALLEVRHFFRYWYTSKRPKSW